MHRNIRPFERVLRASFVLGSDNPEAANYNPLKGQWENLEGVIDGVEQPFNNVNDVTDFDAQGIELEMTYNPLPNWRIAFNGTKTVSIQSNTGARSLEYLRQRLPIYNRAFAIGQHLRNNPSAKTNLEDFENLILVNLNDNLNAQGQQNVGLSEYAWNLMTNYRFQEGVLKGVNIGARARWREGKALGYPRLESPFRILYEQNPDGSPVLDQFNNIVYKNTTIEPEELGTVVGASSDLNNPFMGPDDLNVGVWASYGRKIMNDKINWSVRLDISNLIGDDQREIIRINPDGTPAAYRVGSETAFRLSNSFKF